MGLFGRLKHAWNTFNNKDPTLDYQNLGVSYGRRPDRVRFSRGNERSIVTSVYNRIALDCASIHDVLGVCDAMDDQSNRQGKSELKRIVSMLTRLIQRTHTVAEDAIEYEYEYRDAEYEYEETP